MSTKKTGSVKGAGTATVTRCITYEQLRVDPNFPKGRLGYIGWLFKNMWQGIKRGFPKNLFLVLGIGLFYWIFNLVFLGIINDSCFFGNGRFSRSSTIAYLFAGLVYENGAKGFDWIPGGSMTTWFYNLTFYGALFWLLGNIWRRIRKGGILMPIKDLLRVPKNLKTCWISVTVPFAKRILLATGLGILAGFLLKSPFTLIVLAIWLLLSFGQGGESPLIYLLFIYQGAKNAKSKRPKQLITGADVAVPIFGFGMGTMIAFIVSVVLWNTTDYSMMSRVLCFLPVGVLLVFFGLGGKISIQNKAVQTAVCFLLCLGGAYLKTMIVHADDGGWTESGRNIAGWLANPGTHLMAAAGIGGPAGMIAGWLGNMVSGAALDHVTGGLGSAVAGTAAGAMDGSLLGLGQGAMNAAFSPLGPVGDMLSNAWGGAIDALGGGGGGAGASGSSGNYGSSGASGNYGSSGSSGNSGNWGNSGNSGNSGNAKPNADENNNHKPDLNDPNWRDQL